MKIPNLRKNHAFTVLELMVAIFILIVLFLLLTPRLAINKRSAARVNCVNNLKQVGLAFRIWSGANSNQLPMQVYTNAQGAPLFANATSVYRYFQVMSNELGTPKMLTCPDDKKRVPATSFETGFNNSHVSYFIGLDADESHPTMILAGDRNVTNDLRLTNSPYIAKGLPMVDGQLCLTTNQYVRWTDDDIHKKNGNVVLGDGSVQQLTSGRLRAALGETGVTTNRLLFP
ncbi:MAG: putative major pilin subunit [Pedosphaera sp.]|nr:putative major pilin subunit [Pedosphaera sp.]